MTRRTFKTKLSVFVVLLAILTGLGPARPAIAQPVYPQPALLKDINTDSAPSYPWGSSYPRNYFPVGDLVFFSAWDPIYGRELWVSDGTSEGTRVVKDIYPGSGGGVYIGENIMASVNGILYFPADDSINGTALWRSDGTTDGTWLVKAPVPGELNTDIEKFTAVGDKLFFLNESQAQGRVLWVSDGTSGGTQPVKVLNGPGTTWQSSIQLAASGSQLIFSDRVNSNIWSLELWISDGTAGGTQRFFGPYTANNYCSGMLMKNVVISGKLYFSMCQPGQPEKGPQLWFTDGTTAGTEMVEPSSGYTFHTPTFFQQVGSSLYFVAKGNGPGIFYNSQTLWKLPAGSTTASLVTTLNSYTAMGLEQLDSNTLLYLGDSSIHSGVDLWFTINISTGQRNMVCEDCYPSEVTAYTTWRGSLFFTANAYNQPGSLWVSDGTTEGTMPILDPSIGLDFTNPDDFLSAGSNLFFVTEDDRFGVEPWVFHIAVNDWAYLPAVQR